MNQLLAMRETVALYQERARRRGWAGKQDDPCSVGHLIVMLGQMEAGDMSPSKMGRWLGWAQASAVARGFATLEEMKDLNKRYAQEEAKGD